MSLDEKLFGYLFRKARRALGQRAEPTVAPGSVALEELLPQLGIVASALAEQRVTLRSAADGGSVCGAHITLPDHLQLTNEPEQNQRCYLARVVFDATVVQLGLALERPASSATERVLASLLAAPAVLAQLERELPAARRLLDSVCEHERAVRERPARLDSPLAALQVLVLERLGGDCELASPDPAALQWLARARACTPATAQALNAALTELAPFVRSVSVPALSVWGGIDAALQRGPSDVPANQAGSRAPSPGASEKSMRAKPRVRRVKSVQQALEENPLVHSFEKVHTADEYRGGKKRVDGSDELQEHSAALDELEISELTQSDQTASGIVRADIELEDVSEATEPEAAPEVFVYDEWDERNQRYRPSWCSVYVSAPEESVSSAAAGAYVQKVLTEQRRNLRELSAELARLRNARSLRNRQPDGPDVDIDALIDRYATLQSGHTGADKLYVSRRRHSRELAVLLLLDASLSTDSWILGQRVLDVAKSALIVLGELFGAEEVPTAIASFSSLTRKRCSFSWLKDFEEDWLPAQRRVVSVEPAGYTRIGPALRHASQALAQHAAPRRLLVLISDAKPTDYDRYEGRYGTSDVRKAIQEAQADGISVFALAIDARAAAQLPSMFERGRYQVMSHPDGLARALAELYTELLR